MPSFDLIPLLVQTGYAGLFIALLIYVLREQSKREAAWQKERDERHKELVRLTEETLETLNGVKMVMQQMVDQNRPPFTDWDGEERRKAGRRAHNG